jgi:hypothetical protein
MSATLSLSVIKTRRWLTKVRAGKLTIQEALRQLGRVTQRDRNRERKALVLSLCEAVLAQDHETAEQIAAHLILADKSLKIT